MTRNDLSRFVFSKSGLTRQQYAAQVGRSPETVRGWHGSQERQITDSAWAAILEVARRYKIKLPPVASTRREYGE